MHIMFPNVETMKKIKDGNPEAREAARLHGFHLVRLGLHFYYGMRQTGPPPTRPWLGSQVRLSAQEPPAIAEVKDQAHRAADTLSSVKRARLLTMRAARPRTPAEKDQVRMTAVLHQAHMASRRRAEQGLLAQSNPMNPNPGYHRRPGASETNAPAAMPTTPVFAREPIDRTRPLVGTPSLQMAWGSSRVSTYSAKETEAAFKKIHLDPDLNEMIEAISPPAAAPLRTGPVEADEVRDPRDVPSEENYDCDDIDLQLDTIQTWLNSQGLLKGLGPTGLD